MTRRHARRAALCGLFAAALFFIVLGLAGWSVNFMPAHYLGIILIGFGVAGLCGVNVFHGGPLDPRRDPAPTEPAPPAT